MASVGFFVYVFKTLYYLVVLVSSSTLLLFQWNTYISLNISCFLYSSGLQIFFVTHESLDFLFF